MHHNIGILYNLIYSLIMTLLWSKHVGVMKEDRVFGDLRVDVTSARSGVSVNILI
jgi:hypothetical protein